jgi:mitochondrial fission protein ELM1
MNPQNQASLRVWAVTDNKPGHLNQLRGLMDGLAVSIPNDWHLQTHWVETPVNALAKLKTLRRKKQLIAKHGCPDIILCCGHRTHWQALFLRMCFGGKLVVLMRPSLPLRCFDLCILPYHDGSYDQPHVLQSLGALNKITANVPREPLESEEPQGLILVGGPSKHYLWSDEGALTQVTRLLKASPNIRWTLGTSRRTPASFEASLTTLQETQNFELVPASSTDAQWLPTQFQQSEQVWVSEDSVSMVYEALSSGAQVGLLRLPVKQHNRVSEGIGYLLREQRLGDLDSLEQGSMPPSKPPLQEALRIAKHIVTLVLQKSWP